MSTNIYLSILFKYHVTSVLVFALFNNTDKVEQNVSNLMGVSKKNGEYKNEKRFGGYDENFYGCVIHFT